MSADTSKPSLVGKVVVVGADVLEMVQDMYLFPAKATLEEMQAPGVTFVWSAEGGPLEPFAVDDGFLFLLEDQKTIVMADEKANGVFAFVPCEEFLRRRMNMGAVQAFFDD